MANLYLDHHLALLAHLRGILVALGEAEQVPEEPRPVRRALRRTDDELPRDPESSLYLGQDLIAQVFHYPQIAHLVPATCCGSSAAIACTSCPMKRSPCSSASTSAASKPRRTTSPSTGTRKSNSSPCPTKAASTDPSRPDPCPARTAAGRPGPQSGPRPQCPPPCRHRHRPNGVPPGPACTAPLLRAAGESVARGATFPPPCCRNARPHGPAPQPPPRAPDPPADDR